MKLTLKYTSGYLEDSHIGKEEKKKKKTKQNTTVGSKFSNQLHHVGAVHGNAFSDFLP